MAAFGKTFHFFIASMILLGYLFVLDNISTVKSCDHKFGDYGNSLFIV